MKLNNVWGYGHLFGFSGVDGRNRYYNDFIGTLGWKKLEFEFSLVNFVKIFFSAPVSTAKRCKTVDERAEKMYNNKKLK